MSIQHEINTIHSSGSAATLTAAYSGNRLSMPTAGVDKLYFNLQYTPAEANAYVQVLIETSNNNSTWASFSGVVYGTSTNDLYQVPFEFPLDSTGTPSSTAGTTSTCDLSIDNVPFKYVRVSAREAGVTSTYGTLLLVTTQTSYKR